MEVCAKGNGTALTSAVQRIMFPLSIIQEYSGKMGDAEEVPLEPAVQQPQLELLWCKDMGTSSTERQAASSVS